MDLNNILGRIGIPPRTPFVALFRVHNGWFAWISVRDPQLPYSQWQGTYLHLHDDGSADRITVYDDGHEDVMCIKERETMNKYETRRVDFELGRIPFVQFMRPNGEQRPVEHTTTDHMLLTKAQAIIDAGFRFEIEELSTGAVSMTISDRDGDYVHQLCSNNASVPIAVAALLKTYSIEGLLAVKKAVNAEEQSE